jgi:hypothetical protein
MGYVYLIQPCELKNTNRFKIGMSSKSDLSRLKSYRAGTRYIFLIECSDYLSIERHIIQVFNKNFKKIAGAEYFEGDEKEIIKTFIDSVYNKKFKNDNIDYINNNNIKSKEDNSISLITEKLEKLNIEDKKENTIKTWTKLFAFNNKK